MITLYNHSHCENQLITSTAPPSTFLKCQFLSRETALFWTIIPQDFSLGWGRHLDDFPGTLWLCQKFAIENGHLWWIYPLKMVDLSIVMLVYQRVYLFKSPSSSVIVFSQFLLGKTCFKHPDPTGQPRQNGCCQA